MINDPIRRHTLNVQLTVEARGTDAAIDTACVFFQQEDMRYLFPTGGVVAFEVCTTSLIEVGPADIFDQNQL